ncbi:flagellar hook-associated protein 3 FlgL [Aliiruegeria haliotis]|uniref:Flagellar hook-associated protein 3 FlgL n=1 Tax=Aliiruegeria haliotis TaxID=1280846 RepID=A0A2T0RF74_9RHOB|nr:hypothetical protein [Aliiruegeria haliotis]PRY19854.1 flagellar hook-associated protein 3 FlgL [Aliiruegeria haliotis]
MAILSIGDLASSNWLRNQNSRLKAESNTLVQELSTGQTSSVSSTVGGNFRELAAFEHSLSRLDALANAVDETAGFANATQSALATLQASIHPWSVELANAANTGSPALVAAMSSEANSQFEAAVSRLNTTYAGRGVFTGADTDVSALSNAGAILDSLEAAVAAETSASGVRDVFDAWFAIGGGFDTIAYTGSTNPVSPMVVGNSQLLDLSVSANDPEIKDLLKGIAMVALLDRGILAGQPSAQEALIGMAGDALLTANDELIVTMANVGQAQETIEESKVEMASEMASLELARSSILSIDPFDSATQLQEVQNQLETLFAVTARVSQLSLVDFL